MKSLFDENLSHKLVRRLADLFPDSVHVRDAGLKAADDPPVWEYAKNNDIHQRSFTFGRPPKIIWLRLGNCATSQAEEVLWRNFIAISAFYEDDVASFLSLSWRARSKY